MSSPITEGATALNLENEVEEQSLVETSDFSEQEILVIDKYTFKNKF